MKRYCANCVNLDRDVASDFVNDETWNASAKFVENLDNDVASDLLQWKDMKKDLSLRYPVKEVMR